MKILTDLFKGHHGKITKELYKKAEEKTGLNRKQIYKWLFDKRVHDKMNITLNPFNEQITIFRIEKKGRDITKPPRPIPGITKRIAIFKVERVQHLAPKNSSKKEF